MTAPVSAPAVVGAVSKSPRVERIGAAELWLADCREVVDAMTGADALVSDPPFGISGGSGGDARDYAKGDYAAQGWEDTEQYIADVCVPVLSALVAGVKRAAITPGTRCLHLYPRPADIGCFFAPAAMTHGPWGFVNFHPILLYGRDFRAGKGALPTGRVVTEAAEKNGHPCPKPERAWRWLVDEASQQGELVADPFMGSGTTGVVCATTGRRFVGTEIEPAYYDIARRRIERAYRQADLFVQVPA